MAYNHDAIYRAYAGTVFRIDDSTGAFDAEATRSNSINPWSMQLLQKSKRN